VAINVTCECGVKIAARNELAGKQIDCHTCGKKIRVPRPARQQVQQGAAVPNWLVATTVATSIAAAGGIGFGVMLNNRLTDLTDAVSGQSDQISTQSALLDTQTELLEVQGQRDQGLEQGLVDLHEVVATLDKNVDADSEQLTAQLGDLQTDLEAAKAQQTKHEEELTSLQGKATKLRGEIVAAEQKIEAEMATKAAGFDARVAELRKDVTKLGSDYQTALQDTAKLEKQMANVKKDITLLANGIVAVNSSIPDTTPIWDEIAKLQAKLSAETVPRHKTVFGENFNNGDFWCAIRLDTRNGNIFVRKKDGGGILTAPVFIPSPSLTSGKSGRFDIKLTFQGDGDIFDAVLLDTHTGSIWHCDVTVPPAFITWNRVTNFFVVDYGENGAWRIDVDSSNAGPGAVPRILVTDTTQKNLTYADDVSPRSTVLPLF